MKTIAVLALFAVAVYSQPIHDGELYNTIDMKKLIANDVERNAAAECLMDRAPCGKYQIIRDVVPKILKTKCADCNPAQKAVYEETKKYMIEHHNDQFQEMVDRYAS